MQLTRKPKAGVLLLMIRALAIAGLLALPFSGCDCDEDPAAGCVTASDCAGSEACVAGDCVGALDAGVFIQLDAAVFPDARAADAELIDSGAADSGTPDAGHHPDAAAPDADAPDADAADADAPDLGPIDAGADRDRDGVPDEDDNCPDDSNVDQSDTDLDGMGDACDPPTTFRTGAPTDPGCEYEPPPGMFTPVVEWRWLPGANTPAPSKDQVMSTPAVINLDDDNNDGRVDQNDVPDVVFVAFDTTGPANDPYAHTLQAGVVRALSGDTGAELWSATDVAQRAAPAGNVAVGDLDGDGVPEIVVERWNGGALALRADGSTYWECSSAECRRDTAFWGAMAIADLDGGGPEVIRGSCVIEGTTGVVRFCGTGGRGDNGGVGGVSVAADLDGDGRQEVIAGRTAYTATGGIAFDFPMRDDGYIAVAQLDADPRPELVMVARRNIYRLEHDGTEVWSRPLMDTGFGGPPTVANFDDDPAPELGVASRDNYTVYDADGSVLWSHAIQELSSSRTGSSVFDLDGDGTAEVLYNDENTLFVFAWAGRGNPTPNVVWSTPNSTLTAHEYPVVADVDNDGKAEIIVGANDFGRTGNVQRGLRMFGDTQDNWVSTRPMWNQHSYHVTNIEDDGRIPTSEIPSWTSSNTYRTNLQGSGSTGALAAPDLTPSAPAFVTRCPGAILIGAWVDNRGALRAPAGIVVAFHDGAPAPGNPPFATGATSRPLDPGEGELVVVRWFNPPAALSTVHAVVDPQNVVNECHEGVANEVMIMGVGCP